MYEYGGCQSSSSSLLLRAFLRICSFFLRFSMWSLRSYLFMSLMSRVTWSLPSLLLTSTCFNLRLLLRISSMRLVRLEDTLVRMLGGVSRGGGGGGGGGRFSVVFRFTSSWKSWCYCLISCCANCTFLCRSLLDSCSACRLAWFRMVYSTIMPITSLLLRSSLLSWRAPKTSCHSGGTFSVLKVPSARLNEMEVFFLKEIISDSFCSSGFSPPKKFLILPKKLFSSSFLRAASRLRCLTCSYSSREGQFENIFSFMSSAYVAFLNWKAMLPLGYSNMQRVSVRARQHFWKPQYTSTSKESERVSRSYRRRKRDLAWRSMSNWSSPIRLEQRSLPWGSAVQRATTADFMAVEVCGLILVSAFSQDSTAACKKSTCINNRYDKSDGSSI